MQRHSTRLLSRLILLSLLLAMTSGVSANDNVHTTYLWHLDQPIYWPDRSLDNPNRYQMAYESMTDSGTPGHPENDLESIFCKDDRVAVYQYRMRDAISANLDYPDMGAQASYPGELMENVNSLADGGVCYGNNWNDAYSQAHGWTTSGGHPRLDLVAFSFHHTLAPLVQPETLRQEIRIHRAIYPQSWGSTDFSEGFFPSEMAFSERMIEVLVEEGLEWVVVGSNHVSRACSDYPFSAGGDNTVPPNRADQINPDQGGQYYSMSISRGVTTKEAYPFAYTPHMVRYVNPETGEESKMVAVFAPQGMSWQDGYAPYGTGDIDQVAWANDTAHPMLIVLAHDGDNAYAGGYSYYHDDVPGFVDAASAKGYDPTTIQQYLADYPVDPNDVVHVEDGAWVNADGDFGAPQFINWLWPPVNQNGTIDIENGWGEDFRNWAVILAAEHRAIHAEDLEGTVRAAHVLEPKSDSTDAERAWHFLLAGLNSGFMYYGTAVDMEVKPTIAANEAMVHADAAIGSGAWDTTAPSVFAPQRQPWNPGGYCAGALCGYRLTPQPKDFYVWTFVYDTSGLSSVNVKYRIDADGVNPLNDDANELYTRSSGVGDWISRPMVKRPGSEFVDNIFNNPEIDFFEMPAYVADEYYYEITGYSEVLIDYYVEAVDTKGNVKRSPIQHVYVGAEASTSSDVYTASPDPAIPGEILSITYDATAGSLPDSASRVTLHWGYDGWQGVSDIIMDQTAPGSSKWNVDVTVPSDATQSVDFVFTDGTNWDNNGGSDFHVTVDPDGEVTPIPTPPIPDVLVANAGPDQALTEGEDLVLDGSGSSGPKGVQLEYYWSLDGNPVGNTEVVTVTGLEVGTYTAQLRVTDGEDWDVDDAAIVVEAAGPACGEGGSNTLGLGWVLTCLLPLFFIRKRR